MTCPHVRSRRQDPLLFRRHDSLLPRCRFLFALATAATLGAVAAVAPAVYALSPAAAGRGAATAVAPAVEGAPAASLPHAQEESPEQIVDAFHAAIARGDGDAALALLDPQVVIFESGGAEMSRQEYASHHLGGDMRFSQAVERKLVARDSGGSGDVAWVLSRSETHGTFGEREIHARGTETMILRRTDAGWRIVHIHWSSGRMPNR